MSEAQRVILHHYPNSPFAEKIRLIFGSKRLHWTSVQIPAVMPKPDVVALTGGYRKTPILQLGADIYCDTALIDDVIESLAPQPSLYPVSIAEASRTLAQWADSTLFWTAIPYALQPAGLPHMFPGAPPEAIKAFMQDRQIFRANLPRMRGPETGAALALYLERLNEMMGTQAFFYGANSSIADFSIYHCLWFVSRAGPQAEILSGFPKIPNTSPEPNPTRSSMLRAHTHRAGAGIVPCCYSLLAPARESPRRSVSRRQISRWTGLARRFCFVARGARNASCLWRAIWAKQLRGSLRRHAHRASSCRRGITEHIRAGAKADLAARVPSFSRDDIAAVGR